MAMGLRYRAGAMGVPFMPMRSMLGSDVLGRVSGDAGPADAAFAAAKTMECPFTGETLGARWREIDLAGKTWLIPAERIKV